MNFFFFLESACLESTLASAPGQERSDPGRVNRLRLRLLSFMMKMGGRGAFVYRLSLRAYTWGALSLVLETEQRTEQVPPASALT